MEEEAWAGAHGACLLMRLSAVARQRGRAAWLDPLVPVVQAAVQPAVPADRFAREIVRIMTRCVARLRQLNGNPLGVSW
jgi:hypothetical protein